MDATTKYSATTAKNTSISPSGTPSQDLRYIVVKP